MIRLSYPNSTGANSLIKVAAQVWHNLIYPFSTMYIARFTINLSAEQVSAVSAESEQTHSLSLSVSEHRDSQPDFKIPE